MPKVATKKKSSASDEKVVIEFRHAHGRLSDPKVTAKIWDLFDSPLIEPVKYDRVEKAKKPFSEGANAAADLANNYGALFIKGAKSGFLAHLTSGRVGTWRIWVDAASVEGDKQSAAWTAWLRSVAGDLPMLVGRACLESEFEATNPSFKGATTMDFGKFLSGVYWWTLFGKELVSDLGADKIKTAPHATASSVKGGQIALQLDEPLVPDDMKKRLATEKEIAAHLGANNFFGGKAKPNAKLPTFAKLVDRLENE